MIWTNRKQVMDMKHICNENDFILIEQRGGLAVYQCPICAKKQYELGDVAIFDNTVLPMCKIYIKWSYEFSLAGQIHNLKKIVPALKNKRNQELLNMARNDGALEIGEMYFSEAKALLNAAKGYHLDLYLKNI